MRSPYGLNPDKYGYSAWLREYPHLMKDGYIFAFQDTRGRGASTGEPIAHLFAATTGSDSDWVVKLIDVYPDITEPASMGGFEFMLAEEVFRARYRNSFEKPEAVTPGKITPYAFSLRSRDHTFKAGHRIMVQVQSTWFPLIDRNPQTYVPNIYEAAQSDFRAATQSVYRSRDDASYVSLPVNTK